MTPVELQHELRKLGHNVATDGVIGPKTKAAFIAALALGPDTPLTEEDFARAAKRLNAPIAHIKAVYDVEAAGKPFIDGKPTILPEPHIFSRHTKRKFDKSHPNLSSPKWNRALYPKTQMARWLQLADMVALDVDAGLSSASYGGFQVLGQNWESLGYKSAWDFVWQHSQSVWEQLEGFIEYIEVNGLADALRKGDWVKVAKGYNGPGYAANQYDKRLATRAAFHSKQAA